jgi:hypothetical protein
MRGVPFTVEDTIEVVGGPRADGRLERRASHEPPPALALPFGATVAGEAVNVEKIDLRGEDELIAICRRRGKREKVRLLDVELPDPRPKGAEWVAAYHRWSRRR